MSVLSPMPVDVYPQALALAHCDLHARKIHTLLEAFGGVSEVWEATEAELLPHFRLTDSLSKFVRLRRTLQPDLLLERYAQHNITPLLMTDPRYPEALRSTHEPPYCIFVQGNVDALSQTHRLAIVGTRRYTDYGLRVTHRLVRDVKPFQPAIISGLAAGIDTLAHKAALENRLPTVAVFGTGLDTIFPSTNKGLAKTILETGGALVSEYPLGQRGDKMTFPTRNRIIAGLAEASVIVEGPVTSGALITARYALEDGRPVMAVPGEYI